MKTTGYLVLVVLLLLTANYATAQRSKDGSLTIATPNSIVNTYTYLTADAAAGASSITVNSNAMTGAGFGGALAPGDLILIIQMQGATMDINTTPIGWPGNYTVPNDYFSNFPTSWGVNPHFWGQITNYGNSGYFERVEVQSVSGGNTINLQCVLNHSYTASGHVQVVRIPRYDNLTVNAGASIVPTLWDGNSGGVVALEVEGTLTINGNISASAYGFRGGAIDPLPSLTGNTNVGEVRHLGTFDHDEGSEKGEGIGGFTTEYTALFSRYGIGAPANGGGGGGYQNTGGGGGSNVVLGAYTGKGNPQGYTAIWNLEQAGLGGSTSGGGGRGGYALSTVDLNETTNGPDLVAWGGDTRKPNGGFGGHPLPFDLQRVFMGGGGGAGDQDSGDGGAGGRGGGIIFITNYGTIAGNGTIEAQGENGQNSNPTGAAPTAGNPRRGVDGAGGGGAGGSVHIENATSIPNTITIDVEGGDGGDQDINLLNVSPLPPLASEAGGPGGSGTGGYIAYSVGNPTKVLAAGDNGTTNSSHMVNFPPNGATEGTDGINNLPVLSFYDISGTDVSICSGQTANLSVTVTTVPAAQPLPGPINWYTQQFGGTAVGTGTSFTTPALVTTTTYYVGICEGTFREPIVVTVNPPDDPSFTYPSNTYCQSATDPLPTITGLAGGTFSGTAGLVFVSTATGEIDLSASTLGAHTVTYTTNGPCPNSTTFNITISLGDDASFNYASATYCSNGTDPTPTITGLAGGTFSGTAGLVFVSTATGEIDLSASTTGAHTVTYTTNGPCPNSATFNLTINPLDDASFSYASATYCANGTDPTATITGLAGGTFSGTAGLVFVSTATGEIDLSASTPGAHTVTYTTNGSCPNSATFNLTINALDDASFNYASATYCANGTDPTATITGLAGGTFSGTAGLVFVSTATGEIDLSASTTGAHTVTYMTAGPCPNSATFNLTINTLDDASFSYGSPSYCQSATDPSPTITGLAGGTFTGPAGLVIDGMTGVIDVSASTVGGPYTVTYTTTGPCPNSATFNVSITALDDASFSYASASYCVSGTDPTPTITGVPGGTFSGTAGLVFVSTATGEIDLSASTPGAHTITYSTTGVCANSATFNLTISTLDDASFSYASATYCINGTDPTATITGLAGGTFSGTAGLVFVSTATGEIDLSASTTGAHTVTYTTAGPCPNSATFNLTINSLDDASFSYASATYCANGTDPTATITGLAGGTFSGTVGLVFVSTATGEIDLSASTTGAHTVTYTTNGSCPNSATFNLTINALDDASFNYASAMYCANGTDPTATITGLVGGTFSGTAGLVFVSTATGEIDLSASTTGAHTVTYMTAGPCPNSATFNLTINTLDDASFSYGSPSYCQSATDPTPTITGLAGGTFTGPAGLVIDGMTGVIDVSASTVGGPYTVTYTTTGPCPNSATFNVSITALDDASFNYASASYCANGTDPTPTITGVPGGTFSGTAGLVFVSTATGEIDLSASTPGAHTVTYATTGACANSSNVNITINALDDPSFSYASASYCLNGTDPTATITGLAGGTFSGTAGLVFVSTATGEIDLSASTTGAHTVTYTTNGPCPNSTTFNITINALDDASFSYPAASYCLNAAAPSPTITGLAGGSFSAPAGIVVNPTTGQIDVSASAPGTYAVTYTTNGPCPNSSNVNVTIVAMDDPSFSYGAAAYCVSDPDPTPTITGLAGGMFTTPLAGLSLNATTGAIDVSTSTPGLYTITYTTAGPCPNTATFDVTINAMDDATFNYASAAYCVDATDPTPTITGLAGGTFSSTAGLVINTSTGEIDVSASTPATYVVTYTTNGACPNSSTFNVTINALDDASFAYGSATYCVNAVNPTPTITGLAGGAFTSAPAGLTINPTTGEIDLTASTPGAYTVTYTTAGTCPNSSNVAVTINALDNAAFSYSAASYCISDPDPSPTVTGLVGGTYTSAPAGLSINTATGAIDASASTPGVYTVTYTTNGPCPNTENAVVTIVTTEDPTFAMTPSCDGGTATVSGTAGGTFSFVSPPADGAVIDPVTGTVTGGTAGSSYGIQYTTPGTCSQSSTQNVTVLLSPVLDPIADVVACDSIMLPAITGTNLSGTEGYYNNSQALGGTALPGNTITTSQTVWVYDINNGCPAELSFNVTIQITDDPSFTVTDFCEGENNAATVTGTPGGTFSFAPDLGDGSTVNSNTGEILSPVGGTTYTLLYTTNGTCPTTSTQTVTALARPAAPTTSGDITYCIGDPIGDITATPSLGGSITWYDNIGLTNVIGTSTNLTPYNTTGTLTYYVTETSTGCESAPSTVNVTIQACDIVIPTAITPDGDGANDDWELTYIDNIYPNNRVRVYNRWGNQIFESPQGDYNNNRWDGTYNGQLLPVGSYFYIIEYNDGIKEASTGSVSIILQ